MDKVKVYLAIIRKHNCRIISENRTPSESICNGCMFQGEYHSDYECTASALLHHICCSQQIMYVSVLNERK